MLVRGPQIPSVLAVSRSGLRRCETRNFTPYFICTLLGHFSFFLLTIIISIIAIIAMVIATNTENLTRFVLWEVSLQSAWGSTRKHRQNGTTCSSFGNFLDLGSIYRPIFPYSPWHCTLLISHRKTLMTTLSACEAVNTVLYVLMFLMFC